MIFNLFNFRSGFQKSAKKYKNKEIEELQSQCQRLREELAEKSHQLTVDFRENTFEQLQALLTNYPTFCQMAQSKPDLPASNILALFTPLENLLESWDYETIGEPWQQVEYDPELHQADSEEIAAGELVYIRFVGYKSGEKILCPAKVSRTLPL